MAAKKSGVQEIIVPQMRRGVVRLRIIGTTPMFQNRMAAKAQQTLLVGGRKKTAADKLNVKHNPPEEYRNSMERIHEGPTALGLRVVAVKGAMCTAAIETAGLTKTSAQRLLFMPGDLVPLYGVPQLRMDVVRSADINRTPDVRTRAFIPRWGAEIEIQHILPQLPLTSVVTLACNAGLLIGVGDYRQEKGKGAFGSFRVIAPGEKDAEWDDLVKNHGRKAQLAAIKEPEYADLNTRDLMEYFFAESARRDSDAQSAPARKAKAKTPKRRKAKSVEVHANGAAA